MSARPFRFVVGAAVTILSLAVLSGSAVAGPTPTPNGWVGACNMNSAWPGLSPGQALGIGDDSEWNGIGGGMEHAMTVNNPNGNDGMFNAVFHSGNQAC